MLTLDKTRLVQVSRLIDSRSDVGDSNRQKWVLSGIKRVARGVGNWMKVAERGIVSVMLYAAQKILCAATTEMQDVVMMVSGGRWKSVNVRMGKVASSQVKKRFA